jgi:hypothetical protein
MKNIKWLQVIILIVQQGGHKMKLDFALGVLMESGQ